jgi:hypothetical protein
MPSTDPKALSPREAAAARESARFELIFQRPPTTAELARFRRSRSGSVLRLPRSVKRRAALLITR